MIPAIKQHFNIAAPTYTQHALWQHQQAQTLWDYSASTRCNTLTLDIGSGTGWIACRLIQANIPVIAIDQAQQMLQQQTLPTICADMHAIPLPDQSIGQVFCAMTLQWSSDPYAALAEWRRVMCPRGMLFCSVLTTGTFASLHQAISEAEFIYPGNQFTTADTLFSTAQQAGWQVQAYQSFTDTLYFDSLHDVITHLRLTGCISYNRSHAHGLITPRCWHRLISAYEALRTVQGLPLEFTGLHMRLG